MFQLDHITVAAKCLAVGVSYAERLLGVRIPIGVAHELMGTHNHLFGSVRDLFLRSSRPIRRPGRCRDRVGSPWTTPHQGALRNLPEIVYLGCSELRISQRPLEILSKTLPIAAEVVKVRRGDLEWLI